MKRLLTIALIFLVPLALTVVTASPVAGQQNGDQEHPKGEEEHPKGEEEHPKGEEEHPEGKEEHPEGEEEHPEGEEEYPEGEEDPEAEEEHPEGEEHPEEAEAPAPTAAEPLTIDQLADAIDDWVAAEAAANDGFLTIEHPETGEALQLTLDHVHRERLSHIGDETYFACADFVDADGTVYDLDVFMQGADAASLESTDVTLHKVSGDARYTWFEEDGVWKKQPAS